MSTEQTINDHASAKARHGDVRLRGGDGMKHRVLALSLALLALVLLERMVRRSFHTEAAIPHTTPADDELPRRMRFRVLRNRMGARRVRPPSAPALQKRRINGGTAARSIAGGAVGSTGSSGPSLSLAVENGAGGACVPDGTERGGGCHGGACLMGGCFCLNGAGGDWCELRPSPADGARAHCAELEEEAYGARGSGLERHAAHDRCRFYEPAYGILRVDARRWQVAQEWEAALWRAAPASQTTDRNAHHARQFGGFAALGPGGARELGDVLELGCGPYTQLQSILTEGTRVDSITLADPLVDVYAQARRRPTPWRAPRAAQPARGASPRSTRRDAPTATAVCSAGR